MESPNPSWSRGLSEWRMCPVRILIPASFEYFRIKHAPMLGAAPIRDIVTQQLSMLQNFYSSKNGVMFHSHDTFDWLFIRRRSQGSDVLEQKCRVTLCLGFFPFYSFSIFLLTFGGRKHENYTSEKKVQPAAHSGKWLNANGRFYLVFLTILR